MNKKVKLDHEQEVGLDSFESLSDELVIHILARLATCTNETEFLGNIKLLLRCTILCKRFNALACLVPSLLIRHDDFTVLKNYCPKILKKFKHIRSLEVTHRSCTQLEADKESQPRPIIRWEAAYRPHGYCLAVVAYKNIHQYTQHSQKHQFLENPPTASEVLDFHLSILRHIADMLHLHHMLVSSIKDHKYLQKVVVSDSNNWGMLTLEEDVLVKLRNCTSTNLERVTGRYLTDFRVNLDVPVAKPPYLGFVLDSVCFQLFEWWEKATDDDDVHKDGGILRIPPALPFKCPEAELLRKVVTSMMGNLEDSTETEHIVEILSILKSGGKLL